MAGRELLVGRGLIVSSLGVQAVQGLRFMYVVGL